MENDKNTRERIKRVSSFLVILVIGILITLLLFTNLNKIFEFFSKVMSILTPIIVGFVLAYIINPFYDMVYYNLNKVFDSFKIKNIKFLKNINIYNITKAISVICSVLIWVLVFAGLSFLVIPELYDSLNKFIDNASSYRESLQMYISELPMVSIKQNMENIVDSSYTTIDNAISTYIIPNLQELMPNLFKSIQNVLSIVANAFIGIIVMVYVLLKKSKIRSSVKRFVYAILNEKHAQHFLEECSFANKVFTNFFRGKILDSAIIFILSYIILSIFGMRYALLLSVIIGITNIVPFFGPIVGGIISVILVALVTLNNIVSTGEGSALTILYFAIFIVVLQQFDGNILGPKILSDTTGVDNLYVLISTILFGGLFGFVGLIIAVPLWAVITRLIDEFVVDKLKQKRLSVDIDDY